MQDLEDDFSLEIQSIQNPMTKPIYQSEQATTLSVEPLQLI
jgi:hypothetical protein